MNIHSKLLAGLVFFAFMTMIKASTLDELEKALESMIASPHETEKKMGANNTRNLRRGLMESLGVFKKSNSLEPTKLTPEIVNDDVESLREWFGRNPEGCARAIRSIVLYMRGDVSYKAWCNELVSKSDVIAQNNHGRREILHGLIGMLVANALNYKGSHRHPAPARGRVLVTNVRPAMGATSAASASRASFSSAATAVGRSAIGERSGSMSDSDVSIEDVAGIAE